MFLFVSVRFGISATICTRRKIQYLPFAKFCYWTIAQIDEGADRRDGQVQLSVQLYLPEGGQAQVTVLLQPWRDGGGQRKGSQPGKKGSFSLNLYLNQGFD